MLNSLNIAVQNYPKPSMLKMLDKLDSSKFSQIFFPYINFTRFQSI